MFGKKAIDKGKNIILFQVEKLQEELASEYLRYRDECDARKLLVSDINDLRYQQEDIALSKQGMKDLDEVEEDPVMLKIALKWVIYQSCWK